MIWMLGTSTSGSISLGTALVAGKNRVPSPATGSTALRTRFFVMGQTFYARFHPALALSTPVAPPAAPPAPDGDAVAAADAAPPASPVP